MLEKRGLIERDAERAWLSGDPGQGGALDDPIGHSITCRIAVGARAGQKGFALQSVAANADQAEREGRRGAAQVGGFSLHAGLDIQPGERAKFERLCCYVSHPPVATERLALTLSGQVRYPLKTPYRDGTTHSRLRAAITPAGRGAGGKKTQGQPGKEPSAKARHVAMSWGQRLKRVFAIEIDRCVRCQGRLRLIASIEEPEVIARILAHRNRDCGAPEPELAPIAARATPRQGTLRL